MRCFLLVLRRCVVLFLVASSSVTIAAPAAQMMSAQEHDDQKAIREELIGNAPHRLDLANPLHYRLIQNILARAGESAQKSPELFRRLESAHTEGSAALIETKAAPLKAKPLLDVDAAPTPVDLNFIATFSRNGTQGYQATGLSSILNGSTVTSIVMSLYDDSTGTVYSTASKTEYAQGVDFRLQVAGEPTALKNPTTLAQGLFSYVPLDKPNSPPIVIIQQYTDTINPVDGCMQQPNYCVRNNLNQCVPGQYQTACTNKVTNTTPIKMCWHRQSQQECDYWNATAHPTNFVFPLSGNVQFPNVVVKPAAGVVSIALQNPAKGGGCNVYFQQSQVLTAAYWTPNDKSIAWSFPAAAFPNTSECINYYDGVTVNLWMSAYVALQGSGGPPPFGTINFTSDRSQIGVPGVYIIPSVNIWQGCFAAGTEITLSDGAATRPVERFAGDGQETIATGQGDAKLITGTTIGAEPDRDMVRLTTQSGATLLVTQGHPIILDGGAPILAKHLKIGDRVRTVTGPSPLVAVGRERYEGKVYNLLVGAGDESQGGTMYANGILAGDARMQNDFVRAAAEAERKDPKLARSRLPAAWLADFDNHQN